MARRNDHTREELINLTLATVKDFLEENSYHELSLRKIANMIGYVPSTLVNIFGNYNLLLLHVVAQTLDELSQESRKATSDCKNANEALFELAYCYHDFALKHPYRWQLVFEHNMNGAELPEWQAKRIDGMTGILESLLAEIAPHRTDSEVIQASRVLWSGVHGITLLSVDDKFFSSEPVDGKVLISNLLSNYLNNW
ncbi:MULTISPECIES: TetR/AcrR family transcriptional regulator [Vibrio]|jgi:AcrR family transcriptional regulator|uniref:TetR family transcriptional regulator n=1 Tax=Vibrio natriegens NBRC 15636 = ATCC 14048 = DSM 759 TaxID=1219067 RepID=A0AAN1CV95_VIBNA|nr:MULTISPECIES: TetR-like C-terminal domain-containing protein [Vibrio]MEE3880083.1 TetR-like C-terminal domain-containing protein [Vibrio sp. YYF0003]AEX21359.1 transcriptional regulator [Vibrio sp. EJY3]ALR16087.1 TetR family transcriptional regulator [Vibrio natriegens NBRC 15636 = ATCC 14048 = DSM 759]ANQ12051.1 TetR family transcriptional regulator [Vibrio natriegens NBRC 15636 = ATCC 14048 = DSM 759]ANQ16534.1 TetR family transcriptional regulator [Vibrio natriegens]